MLSFDPGPRRGAGPRGQRLVRAGLFAVAATLALAACTVQPLYTATPAGQAGPTVGATLTQVALEPADDRVSQELRNRLIFLLYGGGEPGPAQYRMRMPVTSTEGELGVTPVESASALSVTVAATYQLTSAATGEIVLRATERSTATYDRTNQAFANTRAKLDAENRAAGQVAEGIHLKLAAAAARGVI